jgi:hypothetical protein
VTRTLSPGESAETTRSADLAEFDAVPEGLPRLRVLLATAAGTVLLGYVLLVPVAAAVVLTAGNGLSLAGALAAAVPLWLAAHQIPLVLGGQPLGVLPLLPTAALFVVVALGAGGAVRRLGGRMRHDGGPVLAGIAAAHAAVAVLGSALLPGSAEVAAKPWAALVGAGALAGAAAVTGMVRACGVPVEWRTSVPGWVWVGLRAAAVAVAGLAAVASAMLVVGLAVAASRVEAAYRVLAPTFGDGVGITLLALAYLPNAGIAALCWALGVGFSVGVATASPFTGVAGPPSSFPLFAALPTGPPPAWAPAVVILPVLVGLLVGLVVRRALPVADEAVRALSVAGLGAASGAGLAALLAGGRLAAGPYDPVHLPAGLAVAATLVWIGIPAAGVALLRRSSDGADAVEHGGVAVADEPAEHESAAAHAEDTVAETSAPTSEGAERPDPDEDEPVDSLDEATDADEETEADAEAAPEPTAEPGGGRPQTVAELVAERRRAADAAEPDANTASGVEREAEEK